LPKGEKEKNYSEMRSLFQLIAPSPGPERGQPEKVPNSKGGKNVDQLVAKSLRVLSSRREGSPHDLKNLTKGGGLKGKKTGSKNSRPRAIGSGSHLSC